MSKTIVAKLLIQGENENERDYVNLYVDPAKISAFHIASDEEDIDEFLTYNEEIEGKTFINIVVDGAFFSVAREENIVEALKERFNLR